VESFNGKCLFLSDKWGTSEQLNLYTDASKQMVKSISRLKITRPGGATEHAKFNRPINDCSSLNVDFFFELKMIELILQFA
jgi:hypothetical protein